jgi:hypothetical protein
MIGPEDLARLAHQGGWDEVGLFALPVIIALGAVWLVERSQRKKREASADEGADVPDDEARGG